MRPTFEGSSRDRQITRQWKSKQRLIAASASLAVAHLAQSGLAATLYWNGDQDNNLATNNAGNTNWSTTAATDTNSSAIPSTGDSLAFNVGSVTGSSFSLNNTLTAGTSLGGLTFLPTSGSLTGPLTLSGNAITLAPSTANAAVTMSRASSTVTVTQTGHGLTTGQIVNINGASNTALNGSYIVTVVNTNSYTYTTTTSGTVASASGNSQNIVTLSNNNSTALGKVTISAPLTLSGAQGNAWVTSPNNAVTAISGNLSGSSNLTLSSNTSNTAAVLPNVQFSGSNSGYTGTITPLGSSGVLLANSAAMTGGLIDLTTSNANLWLTGGAGSGTYTFGTGNTAGSPNVNFRNAGTAGLYTTGGDVTWDPGNGGSYTWAAGTNSEIRLNGSDTTSPTGNMIFFGNSSSNLVLNGARTITNGTGGNNPALMTMRFALADDATGGRAFSTSANLMILTRAAVNNGATPSTTTVNGGAMAVSNMNRVFSGALNLTGGSILLDNTSWSDFTTNRSNGFGAFIATATQPATITASSGGSLAAGTYSYRVVAVTDSGTSAAGTFRAGTTSGGNLTLPLSWNAQTGALYYRVYRVAGNATFTTGDLVYEGTEPSFTDTGVSPISSSVALPTVSTTAATNVWNTSGGGFSARGAAVTIGNTGTTNRTFDRNFQLGSSATGTDGALYADASVTLARSTTLSAQRTVVVGATGPGLTSAPTSGVTNTISGNLSGTGSLIVTSDTNTSSAGSIAELVLSGANSWTGSPSVAVNTGVVFNAGPGGMLVGSGSTGRSGFVRFDGDASLPTGNGGANSYLASVQRNTASGQFGYLLTGDAAGKVYDLPANYRFVIGTASTSPAGGAFGATGGNATLRASTIAVHASASGDSQTLNLLTRSDSTLTFGTSGQAATFLPSFGADAATSSTATTLADRTGSTTLIKRGEGTAILGNIAYRNLSNSDVSSSFAWQVGRATSANSGAAGYFDGAVRGLSNADAGRNLSNSLFAASGPQFALQLRGGVYEIDNSGGNSGTFDASIGTAAGNVNWGGGGGGFAAYGGAVTVALGGVSTPSTINWNTANHVSAGESFILGSRTANNVVTLQNNLMLNNGTREVRVIDNASSTTDLAAIAGDIGSTQATSNLVKTGAGTLLLSGNNFYGGSTTISAGTLLVNTNDSAAAPKTISSTSTANDTITITGHGLAVNDRIAFDATTMAGGTSRDTLYYVQSVVDANTIKVKSTPAGSAVDLTSGFTSGSALASGALGARSATAVVLGDANSGSNDVALLTNGAFNVARDVNVTSNGSGTATLGGNSASSSTFSGAVSLAKSVRLSQAALGTTTFSNTISDASGSNTVTKVGAGVVNLTSATGNSYSGGTLVSAGTLLVNNATGSGTGSGNVTVASTGTLGGAGKINGAVTIQSSGTLSPGNSPGLLSVNNNLTFDAGSTYSWESNVANAIGTLGTNYDSISVTGGTVSIASAAGTGSKLDLHLASGSDFSNAFWNSNRVWTLISGGVAGSNLFHSSNISVDVAGSLVDGGDNSITGQGSFSTAVSGSNLELVWTASGGVVAQLNDASAGSPLGSVSITGNSPNYALDNFNVSPAAVSGEVNISYSDGAGSPSWILLDLQANAGKSDLVSALSTLLGPGNVLSDPSTGILAAYQSLHDYDIAIQLSPNIVDGIYSFQFDFSSLASVTGVENIGVVPEPSTAGLIGLGLVGLLSKRARHRRKSGER